MISPTDSNDKKVKKQPPTAKVMFPGITPEPAAEKFTAVKAADSNEPPLTVNNEPVKITAEAPATAAQKTEPQDKSFDVSTPIKPADVPTVPLTEATEAESAVSTAPPTSEELTKAMDNPVELETLVGSSDSDTLGGFSDAMSKGLEEAMKPQDQEEAPSALPPTANEEK